MKKVRLFVEINIGGGWYTFTPNDCLTLGIPCPKYPSSVFNPKIWDFVIEGSFFTTTITGYGNPHGIIEKIDQKYLISEGDLPSDITDNIRDRLDVTIKTERVVYGITCFSGDLFTDKEYWWQTLYNGSMKLRYSDLVSNFEKWVAMIKGFDEEFDDHRFILWIEE